MDERMRIAELAGRTGESTSALRYYEERGLLRADARSPAGYRLYDCQAVGRVGFIQRAKSLGLSLREIAQLLKEPPSGDDQRRIRHAIAHKLADTERQIANLEVLRQDLHALHDRLGADPPACGHIGDCECWLPTHEEAKQMANISQGCTCCDCTCCPDDAGNCTCCGCASASG